MKKLFYFAVFLMCVGVVVYQYVLPMWLANQLNDTEGADMTLLPEKVQMDVKEAQKEIEATFEKFEDVKSTMPEETQKVSSDEIVDIIDKVKVSEMKAVVDALSQSDYTTLDEAWDISINEVSIDDSELDKFKPYYEAVFTPDKIRKIVATLEEHNLLNQLSGPVIKQTAKEYIKKNSHRIDDIEPKNVN
ncbi:hypothetical protein [Marinigracilibium pacificum]|uniref:Uncharacterized protein n=1 Tax=Marinigracilibium pacificum TaxID=2729599 RepID=A0A848J5I2_9BACT|nr:hypothetical protein [Marinigracilibium pacificum]NMM49724.1 hypothetical protein [Marinigracilibium pacificum]